jgi:hypothetical protein
MRIHTFIVRIKTSYIKQFIESLSGHRELLWGYTKSWWNSPWGFLRPNRINKGVQSEWRYIKSLWMLHGVIEMAHSHCVGILQTHSVILRTYYPMWRQRKSSCSTKTIILMVTKSHNEGATKPVRCNARLIWGFHRIILMVKQSHDEGRPKSLLGHIYSEHHT